MQQTGTLRKRGKRNLSKVNGLSTFLYDEKEDNFTGNIFSDDVEESETKSIFHTREQSYTRLRMSSAEFAEYRKNSGGNSSKSRVTRNPVFHRIFASEPTSENATWNDGNRPVDEENIMEENIGTRTHFLDTHVMTRLKQLIWLGKTSGAFPWKWNEGEYKIEKFGSINERIWFIVWSLLFFQTTCLCLYNFYTLWKTASTGDKTYRQLFMLWFGLQFNWLAIDYNINIYLHGDKMRHYINTLLKFNYDMVKKYVIHLDGLHDGGRMHVLFSSVNSMAQVPISIAYFLMMPFAPVYLFSYIYPKPWYWLVPGAIQQYYVVGQVITLQVLTTWLFVVHTNTTQFWMREIHNHNDSDWTSGELRTPKNSLETFKSLQVLNSVFNDCMAPLLTPMTMVHFFAILISASYVLIRSMNHLFIEEFPHILTYPMAVFNISIDAFSILNMSAQVFDLGCGFIGSWSRTKNTNFRRILMSCTPPRIRVGRFYFLSVSTTVSFFKFVWDNVTNTIVALQ